MKRRAFIEKTAVASGMLLTFPALTSCGSEPMTRYPITDLHVHTTRDFTIKKILELGQKHQVNFGVVEHPISWALKDDKDLENYITTLRKYPVYIGLQPTYPGWSKNYSSELIAQLDYILMDPQIVPRGNGKNWHIWEFDTYIDDTEDFMKRYMDYAMEVLYNEPVDVFAWPLFLPVCIARDYYSLWTDERMQQIITAAKSRNIAIEINDMAHTPHMEFIENAKAQGLKFTFGSDCRNDNAGRLAYCRRIAQQCNLQPEDFYLPERKA
jgi:hypothetical protein